MNIVILDGYLINPGDLNWKEIHALGNCTVYDRTHPQEVLERAAEAEIILTNKVVLRKEMLRQLPKLRYIGVLATGYNIIDVDAAKERGIIVTNVPAYSTMSVAQTVFALLLELTHHTASHSEAVRSGEWSASIDFAFWKYPLVELAG
ncbi:MAG: D-2-hydroxyacid dehydrogenase, partial [Bacteroidetes bacterium]|nr:D-2-hydroxyacid dehydrogenase [Bacteroidota bacterium]